ncbi:uncharacterized protein LOC130621863 [Hydractinia symbiolongicarpus]|uniref:uncharacterized protein LOC130621863 n=1 Tax=Hydractinia symbiolongicarpus TaxID=13093 RepID=UPI00254D0621|nr:uncharacterized protein LOC130621863 [Hydractinia symbiolongicarpus]XP_057293204.1 uncharacterized protein LOC130621863 [Hydractinia symbiolongicarpus]
MSKLYDVKRKLTKGANLREDAALMMEPYNNWEEKIMPAPYTIALLGQLVIISGTVDFKLKEPQAGFKHVQWPDSFRATLAQVTGEGYKAFNIAHQSMDEIRLATKEVPAHLKSAVTILTGGSDYEVENVLPITLHNIEDIASTCKERSEEVAQKFKSVMELVLELQQSCVATHSASETQLREIETQIKIQKIKEGNLKEQKDRYQHQYERVSKELTRSVDRWDKAIDDIPGAGGLIGMQMIEDAGNTIITLSAILGFGKCLSAINLSSFVVPLLGNALGSASPLSAGVNMLSYEEIPLQLIGKGVTNVVETLSEFFGSNGNIIPTGEKLKDSTLEFQKYFFEKQKEKVKTETGSEESKSSILEMCSKGLNLCQEIKQTDGRSLDASNVYEHYVEVTEEAMMKHATCSEALQTNLLAQSTPHVEEMTDDTPTSLSQERIKNAHFKVETAAERLKQAERQFEKASEDMRKNNEALTKALTEMAAFEAEKATHADIIDMLQKGIKKLGLLQEQWAQLSLFFEHIATLIKTSLGTQLNSFIHYSGNAGQQQLKTGVKISNVMRDNIYQTVFEAVKYSSLVNHLATGYFQVSDKYLMGSISKLGKLLALEDEREKKREQIALTQDCEETQKAIKKLISDHNKEFKRKINNRMNAIKNEFKQALPPLDENELQKVKSLARKAITEAPTRATATEQDSYQYI